MITSACSLATCFRRRLGCLLICAAWLAGCTPSEPEANAAAQIRQLQQHAPDASLEWHSYHRDKANTQASPLNQIDKSNVASLVEAWRYDPGGAQGTETQIATNPLVVKGILYGLDAQKNLFALNAATGEQLWVHPFERPFEGKGAGRGLVYWADARAGKESTQLILVALGHDLFAVDAITGQSLATFGDDGKVDLRIGLDRPIDGLDVYVSTPGTVYGDLLLQGFGTSEVHGAAPGYIRAYHIPTGALRWTFKTIPDPGTFGAETWPAERDPRLGGANAWAGITVDTERGIAFVPTGSTSYDFYGANRAGDNLFANTLLALDAATGERLWHYQIVRHDQWDRDLASPPNLLTVVQDGKTIPAVSQATKTGHLFVFHRETGEPLFPIEEVAPQGVGVPGEYPASSQPLPQAPPAFTNQRFEITDISPAATAHVTDFIKGMRRGQPYLLADENGIVLYPGIDGGASWGGQAWDAGRGLLFVNAIEVPYYFRLKGSARAAGDYNLDDGYKMLCANCHGENREGVGEVFPSLQAIGERNSLWETYTTIRDGRGRMPSFSEYWYVPAMMTLYLHYLAEDPGSGTEALEDAAIIDYHFGSYSTLLDHNGLPGSRPPWGSLAAIDINKGELAWKIPLGDYPETIAMGLSGLGAENYGGPVATASGLVFIAATPDNMFRAFDSDTGKLLWETRLPAAGFATPTIYEAAGKQFVVIAAGGGKLGRKSGSAYIAFALPEE